MGALRLRGPGGPPEDLPSILSSIKIAAGQELPDHVGPFVLTPAGTLRKSRSRSSRCSLLLCQSLDDLKAALSAGSLDFQGLVADLHKLPGVTAASQKRMMAKRKAFARVRCF